MPINTFPITLVDAYLIAPKVKHFIFQCDPRLPFSYVPGQFITIHWEKEGQPFKRSYSIANQPGQDNRIELAAGYVEGGPGTEFLFNLQPGTVIPISGPFGRLILKGDDPKRYLLIATSTGITPYRAMLGELSKRLEHNPNLEIVILEGVQTAGDLIYAEDFWQFSKQYPQVTFLPCFSREKQSTELESAFLGYVQQSFDQLNLNPATDRVYLCGNPSMIDQAFTALQNQQFTVQQIIREKYISR